MSSLINFYNNYFKNICLSKKYILKNNKLHLTFIVFQSQLDEYFLLLNVYNNFPYKSINIRAIFNLTLILLKSQVYLKLVHLDDKKCCLI